MHAAHTISTHTVARRIVGSALAVVMAFGTVAMQAPVAQADVRPSLFAMFVEQVSAQTYIGLLNASGHSTIQSIKVNSVHTSGDTSTLAITVHTQSGMNNPGTLVLKRDHSKWYFYSITRGTSAGGLSKPALPAGISTDIMKTVSRAQTNHQSMISGLVSGGYKLITVTGRHSNYGTRTINVRLSGGRSRATTGQIVSIRKIDSHGKSWWFLTDFR